MPLHVLTAEGVRILVPKQLVQPFAGVRQLIVVRHVQREVGQIEDTLQVGHLLLVYHVHHIVAHKQQARLRMVHDVVYLFSVEFMQYGHYHRPIRQRGQKSHCPVG